jgi:Xaa-Pro aminopeptidase
MEQIMMEMRQHMQERSLHAYIVQPVDAHQSEYVSVHDRRRAYVTGFTGSAGTAIIADTKAALWTDSRYFLQAEMELDADFWTLMKQGQTGVPSMDDWLLETLAPGSKVGTDPQLISASEFDRLSRVLTARGHQLVAVDENLVDLVWNTRPEFVFTRLEPFNITYSGEWRGTHFQSVSSSVEIGEKFTFP